MSATTLFLVVWFLMLFALFGLVRLLVARRGTDEDWQRLVAFHRKMPILLPGSPVDAKSWAEVLAIAPPGLLPEPSSALPTVGVVYERVRAYQAMLQAEMKWFAHRLPNPYLWFLSGLRGVALVPFGVAFELDARARARRRALESHPDFQRTVTAIGAVVLFVLLVVSWLSARAGLEWFERLD